MEQPKEGVSLGEQPKGQSIRFYTEEFPKEGDLVMVQIKDVSEYATIVELLEYNNKEGRQG